MSGRGKGGKVVLFAFPLHMVIDNNLSYRVLARVVLSVIAKSFVTTSKVSPSQPSVVSPVVVA
jgi:hypothetical protein